MKTVFLWILYILFGYTAALVHKLYRISNEMNIWMKLLFVCSNMEVMVRHPFQKFQVEDVLAGIVAALFLYLVVQYRIRHAKKYRHGEEYGSARWGTYKDIRPYMDKTFEKNIILTQTEYLTLSGRMRLPKHARNKNVLVIGGSGSGKTRFYLKPNLMQMHSSYVVTDPNG